MQSFFRFRHFTFEGEEKLREETSQKVRSLIITEGDERHDERKRDAGRGGCTLRRKLRMEHLQDHFDRRCAARTPATMNLWPGWLAALLQPDENVRYPCSVSHTGGRLLLTGKGAKAQTG